MSVVEKEFRYLAHLLKMERYKVNDNAPFLKMQVGSEGSKKFRLMIGYKDPSKDDRVFSTAEFMTVREIHYHIVGLVEGIKRGSRLETDFLKKRIEELGIEYIPEERRESIKKAVEFLTKEIQIQF